MTITEYLDTKPMVKVRGGLGQESDWLEFCEIPLSSGILILVDPAYLPEEIEGCRIELPPGDHRLTCKVMTYWQDSRISRLRILTAANSATVGPKLGEVTTDHGLIGVADHAAYSRVWEEDKQAFQEFVMNEIPESGPAKIARLSAKETVLFPFVESGFGDGTFGIYALEENDKIVGVEVEFITAQEKYPY